RRARQAARLQRQGNRRLPRSGVDRETGEEAAEGAAHARSGQGTDDELGERREAARLSVSLRKPRSVRVIQGSGQGAREEVRPAGWRTRPPGILAQNPA